MFPGLSFQAAEGNGEEQIAFLMAELGVHEAAGAHFQLGPRQGGRQVLARHKLSPANFFEYLISDVT